MTGTDSNFGQITVNCLTSFRPFTLDRRRSVSLVWLLSFLLVLLQLQIIRGQQETNMPIDSLSDAFRYSPSSRFAPGDGGASLDWIDRQKLEVLPVTTLDHTGKGSLRWALEEKRGPRLVVFEVGGVIDLAGYELTIPEGHGDVIVAGQTAPSPGITLIRDAFSIRARNVIVQHIRVRPGDDILGEERKNGTVNLEEGEGESVDGLQPGGSSELGNQIIDHVTVSWASDEGLSVVETDGENEPPFRNGDPGPGKRPPVTVSNTIIADTLRNSRLHTEGGHNLGSLLYRGFEHYFLGNLFANVKSRTPWIGAYGGADALVVNTLMHVGDDSSYPLKIEANGKMHVALIGNRFSGNPNGYNLNVTRGDNRPKQLFLHDNDASVLKGKGKWEFVDSVPLPMHDVRPLPGDWVLKHHVQTAGARPADRTPLDKRVIRQVREGDVEYLDSQRDVGGYPDLPRTRRSLDIPRDSGARGRWLYQHTKAVELHDASAP